MITVNDLWELRGDTRTESVWALVKPRWASQKLLAAPSLVRVLLGLSPGLIAAALVMLFLNSAHPSPRLLLPSLTVSA